jgi:hypothetical protein
VVNVEEMGKHVEKTICTDVPQVLTISYTVPCLYLKVNCHSKLTYSADVPQLLALSLTLSQGVTCLSAAFIKIKANLLCTDGPPV